MRGILILSFLVGCGGMNEPSTVPDSGTAAVRISCTPGEAFCNDNWVWYCDLSGSDASSGTPCSRFGGTGSLCLTNPHVNTEDGWTGLCCTVPDPDSIFAKAGYQCEQ
jgi:hypothetical protein